MASNTTSDATSAVTPAKRSDPPPPADLSKPNAGQRPSKRVREIKFDPTLLPQSSDEAEIVKQVEFYFSDANLPHDKFLWSLTQADPKKEGWVSIKQIASFKRMQRFKPLEAVVKALRTSKELLEVSEDGTLVRRKIPLVKPTDEQYRDKLDRSVHVKGFGDETPTLQIDLEAYFRGFGEIESLRLRRTATGSFKGSVIVEFKIKDDAEAYLSEPREWNGNLLEVKKKEDWLKTKEAEFEQLSPEERAQRDREREKQRLVNPRFSAFKEMNRREAREVKQADKKDRRNRRGQGPRGGREGWVRGRSRSPDPVEDENVTGEKRPNPDSPSDEPSSKREKLEDSLKRTAEDELNGDSKKAKVDDQ